MREIREATGRNDNNQAYPVPKRPRFLGHHTESIVPDNEASICTPYRPNAAGWVQRDTPVASASPQAPKQESFPDSLQEMYPSSACTAFHRGPMPSAALKDTEIYGTYLSPTAGTADLPDFSTTEVKRQLSRLQTQSTQSQQALNSIPPGSLPASQEPGSCRQLTWPDSAPSSDNTDASVAVSTHQARADPSQASFKGAEKDEMQRIPEYTSNSGMRLAPGLASAADLKAVEKQQKEVPRSRLRRKLADWGVPPKVADVSLQLVWGFLLLSANQI